MTFINDTPRVSCNNIRADFTANREGVEISCHIPKLGNEKINCKLLRLIIREVRVYFTHDITEQNGISFLHN